MTDVIDAPGIGHNQPDPMEMEKKHQKWDRWAKKRTFVRALEGTYSHLYKTLVDEKRVYSAGDVAWKGGPQMFGKSIISPQATQIIQSIESHIEAYAPKTGGQKHGHLNSAVFYVLKGHGHDVHDGQRDPVEGRRRDAGRERMRAPALQRFRNRGMHPPRVQGEAAVPVHAPVAPEDGRVAAGAGSGTGSVLAADRSLRRSAKHHERD